MFVDSVGHIYSIESIPSEEIPLITGKYSLEDINKFVEIRKKYYDAISRPAGSPSVDIFA
jgi:hypothetical protein